MTAHRLRAIVRRRHATRRSAKRTPIAPVTQAPRLVRGPVPMTLDSIGKALEPPVTREAVRQIEARALRKLRERCERQGLSVQDVVETWRASYGPRRVPGA